MQQSRVTLPLLHLHRQHCPLPPRFPLASRSWPRPQAQALAPRRRRQPPLPQPPEPLRLPRSTLSPPGTQPRPQNILPCLLLPSCPRSPPRPAGPGSPLQSARRCLPRPAQARAPQSPPPQSPPRVQDHLYHSHPQQRSPRRSHRVAGPRPPGNLPSAAGWNLHSSRVDECKFRTKSRGFQFCGPGAKRPRDPAGA